MDIVRVEKELKKRLSFPYKWGRKQSDDWDSNTNFIYKTYSFERLLDRIKDFSQPLKDYAMNRWFNFWSAMAVENIFSSHTNVQPNKNSCDKSIDFKINGIPFDHKTSVFPKGFNNNLTYARIHQDELIKWLYENQSQQGRKHLKNRLFVILYDKNTQEHWKIKSEIILLKKVVDNYVLNFLEGNLKIFDFGNGKVYSDIIWLVK